MQALPVEIVINILQLIFPVNSVLFLTSYYFNNLQVAYYEYLGCTDDASKNFMRITMNMHNTIGKIVTRKDIMNSGCCYRSTTILFANETLTMCMNNHLDLLIKKFSTASPSHDMQRTQIIFSMAYQMMKKSNSVYNIPQKDILYELFMDRCDTWDMSIRDYIRKKYSNEQQKKIIQFNVNLINIFHSMIGYKKILELSSTCILNCKTCTDIYNRQGYYGEDPVCDSTHVFVEHIRFTITKKQNPGPGRYFYYPNWYNKVLCK